ncbi:MAG: hypothetical protein JSV23_08160 [Promethearchaeota archaeon]|nr:MAG: hypothetical protein JSV23_08160 [Candidatus Lokiarchaeota archaeon]
MSNADKIISLNITKFPQNLLVPSIENEIIIQAINNSSKEENFKFDFEGENLNIKVEPESFNDNIKFAPGETKNITLKLDPTADGFGKLNINAYWLKIVEYTVKVQKVREITQTSKIKDIFKKQAFSIKKAVEIFNSEEFIIDMTHDVIRTAEQQLEKLREEYKASQAIGSANSELRDNIDKYVKNIAKGYLSVNNPQKSLELALILSNKNEQIKFYSNLIRAYASRNLDMIVQLVTNLQDLDIQQKLFESIALDQLSNNPEQAIKIGNLIKNRSVKEDILINIYAKIIESNPLLALNLVNLIDDSILKAKVLFNIAKNLHEQNERSELINVLNLIINLTLKSFDQFSTDKKSRKISYKMLKNAISSLAEVDSPQTVHSIIELITNQELKEKISKDIFDIIYVMLDEIRKKVDAKSVFSQYYLLNTYISTVNNDVKNFSLTGGNVSNNVLTNDFNFNIAFLSLFSFDFSIFPILDRVYNDLKYSLKKSIAYYLFPSKDNYNENELKTLKSSLKQFFKNLERSPKNLLIFNLDFIPYLGKPTVIMSAETELKESFYSKIKKMGETINLIVDDSFFKGGKIYDELTQIFPTSKSKIINLVLSYEFINDYNVFKSFIQSLL